MSTSVFTHEEEEDFQRPTGESRSGGGAPAITREARSTNTVGRNPVRRDMRKYPNMDIMHALSHQVTWSASKADRVTAAEARQYWTRLLSVYDMQAAEDGFVLAFINAILFQHVINGGSTLQPRRTTFHVAGVELDYSFVLEIMDDSLRRFFRTMADETRAVCQTVINEYDPRDAIKSEKYHWLMEVAAERGIQRYPTLCFDSASACTGLSPPERAAVASSGNYVIGNTLNTADTLRAGRSVLSADKVDSGTGANVPHATAVNSGRSDI